MVVIMYAQCLCIYIAVEITLQHAGILPLVVTSDVSPAGNHSVRIVASPGVEDTLSYTISDAAEPTGKTCGLFYSKYSILVWVALETCMLNI